MERLLLAEKLQSATEAALAIARDLVDDVLPDAVQYLIRPNCSFDGNPLHGDQEVFPDDSLPANQVHLPPTNAAGVVDFLWRRDKVPEWINIAVATTDADYTYLFLECCGRFTASKEYYTHLCGYWPFHVKSPSFPKVWARKYHVLRRESNPLALRRSLSMAEVSAKIGKFRLENGYVDFYRRALESRQGDK